MLHTKGDIKTHFVRAIHKNNSPRIITGHKSIAMKFTNLTLAESFRDFLNNGLIFPNGHTYHITMEHVGYQSESHVRMQLSSCIA